MCSHRITHRRATASGLATTSGWIGRRTLLTAREVFELFLQVPPEGDKLSVGGCRATADKEQSTRESIRVVDFGAERAKSSPDAVSNNGRTDLARQRISNSGWRGRIDDASNPAISTVGGAAIGLQTPKLVTSSNPLDQADNRCLPRRRRALTTDRPALEAMRFRKPCLLARFRTFG